MRGAPATSRRCEIRAAISIVLACAVAAFVARKALVSVTAGSPLRARNHRGLELPLGSGIAVVAGALLGWGTLDVASDLLGREDLAAALPGFALLALGFAFLGLFDDLAGDGAGRGWRAHVGALRALRVTPGALKLTGGAALALIATGSPDGFGWGVGRAALIALSANLVNLLDVRPGRASKVFLLAGAALAIPSMAVAAPLAVALVATLVCFQADLRERVMLGDVGANALGAILGTAAALHASRTAIVVSVAILALLHVVADRPGLSTLIDRIGPLRAADRAGRVTY